jgi:preprotein translocase subunit SecF
MIKRASTTNIDFLGYRYWCFGFSLLLLISFIGGALYKKYTRGSVYTYSVDFEGGTQVLLDFSKSTKSEEVIRILETSGLPGATAREFSDHEILVRVKQFESDAKGLGQRIQMVLEKELPNTAVKVLQTDSVGVGIGSELRTNSIVALIISLIGMLLYLWFRFWSFSYGMGSVVALMHDMLVILSLILWFDYEVSMNVIAAVLFILGYSVNDTIVIFARIRENINKRKDASVYDVVNISINETLRRTLLTSFATTLTVLALLLFGGEVLRLLSLSILVGIVFGTYSSIYVASPVMLLLYKEKNR